MKDGGMREERGEEKRSRGEGRREGREKGERWERRGERGEERRKDEKKEKKAKKRESGTEQRTRPMPTGQQHSEVAKNTTDSELALCFGEAGPSWSIIKGTTNADGTVVANRLPGIKMHRIRTCRVF